MVSYTSSSVPHNPTLRSAALNTVIVIPLLSKTNDSHSSKSFKALFESLSDINLEGELSLNNRYVDAKEITLVIPNSNLTPPGDWRYDDTPLRSHDWSVGCQRLFFVDGKRSVYAHDRIKAFHRGKMENSQYGDFVDLYPGRGTAAVIGVLNVKDCKSNEDLAAAENELEMWKQKFTPMLYSQKYWEEAFDSPLAPKHFVTKRMFVFDSFEEDCTVDLTKAQNIAELVSFPPTQSMNFHLNVVINDLAVNIFQNLEKRIRLIDDLSADRYDRNRERSSKIEDVAKAVTAENILNSSFEVEDDDQTIDETVSNSKASLSSVKPAHSRSTSSVSASSGSRIGVGIPGGLKTLAASAGKALWKPTQTESEEFTSLPPIEHELQTPLDSNFDESKINSKDIAMIFKRNEARRQKYAGDLALMAGSTVDAYDRYTQATLGLKKSQDPLWYAVALEGIASSFVAMADIGGGFGDAYLENNFQYPEKIMAAALNIIEDGKDTKVDKTKTTMPAAVYALLQEASEILSRHIKLASLYSEILLKTAWYAAELEELHVRCRWGEGFSGSVGDEDADGHKMTAALSGSSKRWELTSVSKIDLARLREAGKLESVLSVKAVNQCKKFTELLHQSVSNVGIDSYTRAQIAGRCAKLCLRGVRVPNWGATDNSVPVRFHFTRKAAFFTVVAAESISQSSIDNAKVCAAGFWAAASHLYSKQENKFEGKQIYGWASLRSTILHGLGTYGGDVASERAMETLLLLLGECAPSISIINNEKFDVTDVANRRQITDLSSTDRIISLDLQRKQDPNSTKLPVKTTFFRAGPSVLQEQSKWVDGESASFTVLPLVEPSSVMAVSGGGDHIQFLKKADGTYNITSSLICLNANVSKMNHRICTKFQKEFSVYLSKIRRALPTLSTNSTTSEEAVYLRSSISPLGVVSARFVQSESHQLLNRLKSAGYTSSRAGDSLATFFNPYAKNKEATMDKNLVALIAQGEQRVIIVEFSNHLSIPLEIPQCRLVFDKSRHMDIDAPPLSFIVPPKSTKYPVKFPFMIGSVEKLHQGGNEEKMHDEDLKSGYDSCDLVGIHVASFNRTIFFPFRFAAGTDAESGTTIQHDNRQIPERISLLKFEEKPDKRATKQSIKLEVVPYQPNLLVSFESSSQPLENNATISVHLSDGEIFTLPALRIENDVGSSGKGIMERLQVIGIGLPGLPEEILFDTDEQVKELEEQKDRFSDQDSSRDFEELMENDGMPPLKMKCLAYGLSLESLNDRNKATDESSTISLQVAATHDMGNMGKKLVNGGNVRIRFRYRGPSSLPGTEIWKKQEINLNIVRVKGPSISSLTFRTDLSWGGPYSDLCWALSRNKSHQVKVAEDSSNNVSDSENFVVKDESFPFETGPKDDRCNVLNRVGMSQGVFIAKDDIVILMTVANETNTSIVLSNRAGRVGGFENSPMETVTVSSGVSVKIPVVIPRINCIDENGNMVDIARELMRLTALQWNSEEAMTSDGSKLEKRQGRVRIPSQCLRQMINDHPSFLTRICKPPFIIQFEVGENRECEPTVPLELLVGNPLDLWLNVKLNEWVPRSALHDSIIVLEFCCARLDSGINAETFVKENEDAYVWCGQIKKGFSVDCDDLSHRARVCFICPGDYVVTGCTKIVRNDKEEVWFAPFYQSIKVPKME